MMTDYKKLQDIIEEIDVLVGHHVTSSVPGFVAWKSKTERFLIKKYGNDSLEYKDFSKILFTSLSMTSDKNLYEQAQRDRCKKGLLTAKFVLKNYLEEMLEDNMITVETINNTDCRKIFIVHGHDGELKEAVARLVEKQDLTAIILNEQVNKGKTIIEKIEGNSDVGGAICLFTADDLGCAKDEPNEQPRARQNVVFEAGYFMGKLGRDRVVIIAEKGVELPSDMQGIVYSDKNDWQVDVLKELKAMSYTIDFNKFF